jgi:hypothetical protein
MRNEPTWRQERQGQQRRQGESRRLPPLVQERLLEDAKKLRAKGMPHSAKVREFLASTLEA